LVNSPDTKTGFGFAKTVGSKAVLRK